MSDAPAAAADILNFWFGNEDPTAATEPKIDLWFRGGPELDDEIRTRFAELLEQAKAGGLDDWEKSTTGHLALIILRDQFSRNIHRKSPRAFEQDAQSLASARRALDRRLEDQLGPQQQMFLAMPLMHSEEAAVHIEALAYYERMLERAPAGFEEGAKQCLQSAHEHKELIDRFGRYPHRNAVLGRANTPEEQAYLDGGAERFGQ